MLKEHKVAKQGLGTSYVRFKCLKCDYISNEESEVKIYDQMTHKTAQVNVNDGRKNKAKYIKIKCEHCEFEYKFNKQLRKHTLK